MGIQINLKDVDFGNSGFTFYEASLEQGGVKVIKNSSNMGSIETDAERIRAVPIVYVEEGQSVTFYGLKGKDANNNDCTLRVDGVMYSQQANPGAETAVATISDSNTSFYHVNDELNDECTWVNNVGTGWFIFAFGSNHTIATSVPITPAGFNIAIKVGN